MDSVGITVGTKVDNRRGGGLAHIVLGMLLLSHTTAQHDDVIPRDTGKVYYVIINQGNVKVLFKSS